MSTHNTEAKQIVSFEVGEETLDAMLPRERPFSAGLPLLAL
jgi:hypothetical protein